MNQSYWLSIIMTKNFGKVILLNFFYFLNLFHLILELTYTSYSTSTFKIGLTYLDFTKRRIFE
jgi:hypothetical protein